MTWYYAIGNERQGPVDDAELDRLLAARTITPETLVWRAGMTDWQPLGQARPTAARPAPPPPAPPPAPTPTPASMTPISTTPSTPAVSDPATQPKFGSPATFGTPGFGTPPGGGAAGGGYGASTMGGTPTEDPDTMLDRIARSGRRISIGDAVGRGWQLVSANFGLAVGTTAVVWIAMVIAGVIPCLGFFISLVVRPVLIGGLFLFFIKLLRNQNAEFGDAFSGFSIAFLPLFLQGLVTTLLTILVMAPGAVMMFIGSTLVDGYRSEAAGVALMALGFLVLLPPLIYISVIWVFSLPLIIDKRMDFWPAMELSRKVAHRNFLPLVGLLIVIALMFIAGVLALCLGIFVAMPVAVATLTVVYEDLFGQ
jgi:uncharacterized membrane protein